MPRDAVSRTAHVGTVGTNGLMTNTLHNGNQADKTRTGVTRTDFTWQLLPVQMSFVQFPS